MPDFRYQAKDTAGKTVKAFITAFSKEDAIDKISRMGYFPVSVDEVSSGTEVTSKAPGLLDLIFLRSKVTVFARQLSGLLKGGVSALNSIKIMADQSDNAQFKHVLETIFKNVKDGKSISDGLAAYPAVFDSFFVSMVRVGEDNGSLPEVLSKLVQYRKRQDDIRAKIKGAFVYPSIVGVVGFFSVLYIITYVLPKLISLIEKMGMQKPMATVILIDIVKYTRLYFVHAAAAVLIAVYIFINVKKTRWGKLAFDRIKLAIPVFGNIVLKSEVVTFARTLKTSLESGFGMLRALELSTSVLTNEAVKLEVTKFYEDVRSGGSLSEVVRGSKLLPKMVGGLISVGEESGKMTEALDSMASEYEEELDEKIKLLLSLLEPAIILVLGAVVGFIAIAIILPVFSIDVLQK